MSALDKVILLPRLVEVDHVDVAAPAERAHEVVRYMDVRRSGLVRALLFMRGLPERLRGQATREGVLDLDALARHPGCRVLVDDATTYAACAERLSGLAPHGPVTVGWEVRCSPLGERASRVAIELRVTTDDEPAWRDVERAFRLLGPLSRLVRRHVLELVVGDLGAAATVESVRPLAEIA